MKKMYAIISLALILSLFVLGCKPQTPTAPASETSTLEDVSASADVEEIDELNQLSEEVEDDISFDELESAVTD